GPRLLLGDALGPLTEPLERPDQPVGGVRAVEPRLRRGAHLQSTGGGAVEGEIRLAALKGGLLDGAEGDLEGVRGVAATALLVGDGERDGAGLAGGPELQARRAAALIDDLARRAPRGGHHEGLEGAAALGGGGGEADRGGLALGVEAG